MLTDSQKWLVLAVVAGLGWLLYLLSPVLTPFLLGALFAYLGDPLVDRLESWGLSRTASVVAVFLAMTVLVVLLLLLLLPVAEHQMVMLTKALPGYLDWANAHVRPWLMEKTGLPLEQLDFSLLSQLLKGHWSQAGGMAANVLVYVSQSGMRFLGWAANLLLIPVVTFYLLKDWDALVAHLDHLLPRRIEPAVAHLARESNEVLGAFLRGQLMVMVSLGIIYSVGLWLADVQFALLIGMLAGLVSFVPYLGFIVGVAVASAAVLFQTHELFDLLPVLLVFGVGQAIEGMVLTPQLVGDRIGLHPVIVIFAVVAGAQLFGFGGMLLALPVAAVLAVVVRDLHRRYLDSGIYGSKVKDVAGKGESA